MDVGGADDARLGGGGNVGVGSNGSDNGTTSFGTTVKPVTPPDPASGSGVMTALGHRRSCGDSAGGTNTSSSGVTAALRQCRGWGDLAGGTSCGKGVEDKWDGTGVNAGNGSC